MPDRAESTGGGNAMEQTYSLEIDLERGGETLWIYASWAEITSPIVESDSTIVLASSANKAQGTAKRMADICEGRVDLE